MKAVLRKINAILNYEVIDGDQKVPLFVSLVIIVAFVAGLLYAGMYLGNNYFWYRSEGETRIQRDFKKVVTEIRDAPDNAAARLKLGWVYYQQGDLKSAEKHYKESLMIDRNNFSAYLNLGVVYFDQKNYTLALEYLKKAQELNPKYETTYFYLGVANFNLQKYDEALKYLKPGIALDPSSADNHYYYALVQEKLKDYKSAKEHLEIALSFDPEYKEAQEALTRVEQEGKVNIK